MASILSLLGPYPGPAAPEVPRGVAQWARLEYGDDGTWIHRELARTRPRIHLIGALRLAMVVQALRRRQGRPAEDCGSDSGC